MAIVVTSAVSALEQIHSINMRAVFGGSILILCCLIIANIFKNSNRGSYYVFLVLIGVIGVVSGILLASAIYVTQNRDLLTIWSLME